MGQLGMFQGCSALCAATLLLACGDEAAGGNGESIDIGVLYSTVGAYAQYEPRLADATQIAVEQINSRGGVLGKQLRIIANDFAGDEETAKQFTRDFVALRHV